MKPTRIFEVLDLALEARKKGQIFNPLFAGAAGVGKSQICQQWVNQQRKNNPNFGFIDLRIAYMEQPDFLETTARHIWRFSVCALRGMAAEPEWWAVESEQASAAHELMRASGLELGARGGGSARAEGRAEGNAEAEGGGA
jgi:hypothetical protein